MALLSIKTRQKYLKELGFYTGKVDGIEGHLTKQAYLGLQTTYFSRKKDRDGLYGKNTDILLRSAYNLRNSQNFNLQEFKCKCGGKYCTGYPAVVDENLVNDLQKLRAHYDKSVTITSGLRCKTYNAKIGGVKNSSHTKGKAVDIFVNKQSANLEGREAIVDFWDTLPNAKYAYCNGYMKYVGKKATIYNSKTMGNATHVNVK